MLELQFLRIVPLVLNPIAVTILFCDYQWYLHRYFDPFAAFLLLDWTVSCATIGYAAWKMRAVHKAGYFQVPVYDGNFGVRRDDPTNRPTMGAKLSTILALLDVAFIIAFTVLSSLAFIQGRSETYVTAGVLALITSFVHLVCAITSVDLAPLRTYKIKVMIVRRDQDQRITHAPAGNVKERSTSDVSSLPEMVPETLSSQPYRGSPSTKPTRGVRTAIDSQIKLIEPTEGDALIADVD